MSPCFERPAAEPQPLGVDCTAGGLFEPVSPTTQHENAALRTAANTTSIDAVAPQGGAGNGDPLNPQRSPQPTAVVSAVQAIRSAREEHRERKTI